VVWMSVVEMELSQISAVTAITITKFILFRESLIHQTLFINLKLNISNECLICLEYAVRF